MSWLMQKLADTSLLDAFPDTALYVGSDCRVINCNAPALHFLGSDTKGQDITQLIRTPSFLDAFKSVLNGAGRVEFDMEIYGAKRQLARVYIDKLATAEGFLVVLRDFTREQAVEKMRSDFVANASHEMRTPLASIIGSIETLQGAARDDEQAREQFLSTMLSQAQRMKRLIDDLLTLSRIELNENVKPNAKVNLNDIARQARSNLADLATVANVSIEITNDARTDVLGEPDELLQVAQNLLENAIKYGSSGGRVKLECYSHQGNGFLSVTDFGKGIPEIHLPRLTERFYRVSTQESRSRGGTGLGLAIVKHIVLRHRGKLTVTSKEGEGSTFTVSIPLNKSQG
jgi:two-component system, OmpR family, phosphate regulon sensor histidine kinase PhoR